MSGVGKAIGKAVGGLLGDGPSYGGRSKPFERSGGREGSGGGFGPNWTVKGQKAPAPAPAPAAAGTVPAAPAAAAAAPAAAAGPATTVGATATNTVGTMGAGNTSKSGRRRGRFETLLSDLGGAAERFGD